MASASKLVFVSGYAPAGQPGLQAFLFDEERGSLAPHGAYTGIHNPSFLIVHPKQPWIYAVSETGKASDGVFGAVCALQYAAEPFNVQAINQQTSRGDWPCHLRLDATGRWLVTTNYGSGSAALYQLQEDGALGEMSDFVQHQGTGPNTARQEGPHAHSSIFTPDNRFVIIADLGIDQLVIYELDQAAGKLRPHGTASAQPGAGPRHLIFHPNGQWLYAANELNSTVTLYDYDAARGALTERQTLSTLPAGAPENIVADIHITDAGTRLFVSNRGHNSLAAFDIQGDGTLKLIGIPACAGNWPRNFALAPGGRFVLVANQYSNEICVLPIVADPAVLGAPVMRVPFAGAVCLQFV